MKLPGRFNLTVLLSHMFDDSADSGQNHQAGSCILLGSSRLLLHSCCSLLVFVAEC